MTKKVERSRGATVVWAPLSIVSPTSAVFSLCQSGLSACKFFFFNAKGKEEIEESHFGLCTL